MSILVITFLLTIALALLFSSWRGVLVALSLQGAVMTCLVVMTSDRMGVDALTLLADLVLVRVVCGPAYLWQQFHAHADAQLEMLPANLFLWCVATTVGVSAFWAAGELHPTDASAMIVVGAAFSQVLLGLFSLAYQKSLPGQLLGVLVIESGILLLEVTGGHFLPWFLQAGMALAFAVFLLLAASLVHTRKNETGEAVAGMEIL
jgi:hydrogenase-4 membrane subunit HyfE